MKRFVPVLFGWFFIFVSPVNKDGRTNAHPFVYTSPSFASADDCQFTAENFHQYLFAFKGQLYGCYQQ